MEKINIHPNRLKQFGNTKDCNFCLVTNSELLEYFQIIQDNSYKKFLKVVYDKGDNFLDILNEKIPENSHVLIITPKCLIHSINPEFIGKRKLLIFASNSAPTSLEAIKHFLRCGEKTDPLEQEKFVQNFFNKGEVSNYLKLINKEYNSEAIFYHLSEEYGWHDQCGLLDWGQQQVFPSGEIACFLVPLKADDIDFNLRFNLNGSLPLQGFPVLHSGSPSFLLKDQERIYQKLATINKYPVIADVKDGLIVAIEPSHKECKPAATMLNNMFEVDSRFRIIYEVGFAINHHVVPFPTNSAMNEVSGGKTGTIHFGIGMLPFTQYHLDIICPKITVLDSDNKFFFGNLIKDNNSSRMNRIQSSQCPCLGE